MVMTSTPPSHAWPMPPVVPPGPWVALLLSVLWPGAGHLYAGEVRRALALVFIQIVSLPTIAWLMVHAAIGPLSMVLPLLAILLFQVWVMIDAWRAARRHRAMPWRAGRRWGILATMTALVWLVLSVVEGTIRANVARAARVPSVGMEPTILRGDYVLLATSATSEVARGDIVTWRSDEGEEYIHRVVGVAGDTLSMQAATLWRNGDVVTEPYARYEFATNTTAADSVPGSRRWGPLVVARDSVFVLGDNRDNSADSRYRGFVALQRVEAHPRRVYFSRDPDTGEIRWRRIGGRLGGL